MRARRRGPGKRGDVMAEQRRPVLAGEQRGLAGAALRQPGDPQRRVHFVDAPPRLRARAARDQRSARERGDRRQRAIGERVAGLGRAQTDAVDEDDEDRSGLAHRGRLYRGAATRSTARSGVILAAMAETSGKKGIKSAYERALERMESEGIERPREEAFSPEVLAGMEEARKRAEAKLAELEILHKGRLRTLRDPVAFANEEKEYQAERRRIEERRERDIAALRDPSRAGR